MTELWSWVCGPVFGPPCRSMEISWCCKFRVQILQFMQTTVISVLDAVWQSATRRPVLLLNHGHHSTGLTYPESQHQTKLRGTVSYEHKKTIKHNNKLFTAIHEAQEGSLVLARSTAALEASHVHSKLVQEVQISPSDRAMRLVRSNLASYHTTVQKLLTGQVLTKPMVWSWRLS